MKKDIILIYHPIAVCSLHLLQHINYQIIVQILSITHVGTKTTKTSHQQLWKLRQFYLCPRQLKSVVYHSFTFHFTHSFIPSFAADHSQMMEHETQKRISISDVEAYTTQIVDPRAVRAEAWLAEWCTHSELNVYI